MLSLKGDLDKKTKGTPKSFERSLDENTPILENLVTKLRIWGVLETKHLPGHLATVIVDENKIQRSKKQWISKRNVCYTNQKTQ